MSTNKPSINPADFEIAHVILRTEFQMPPFDHHRKRHKICRSRKDAFWGGKEGKFESPLDPSFNLPTMDSIHHSHMPYFADQ